MIKRNFDKVLVLEDDAIILGTPNDLKDIINDGNDYYYYYYYHCYYYCYYYYY